MQHPPHPDILVPEPLEVSAPMALALADSGCRPTGHAHACAPYHGLWQYLRLLGMGKTLSGFSREFVQSIRAEAQAQYDRSAHVLVSGCADYSAFAHAWHACQGLAHPPVVTALDLCDTPLALTRWYAERYEASVRTICCNVLDHQPGPSYDLILTSSFLGYFTPHQRQQLFERYASMLHPGGAFVFTTRLRNGPEDVAIRFTPDQATALLKQVVQALTRLPSSAALSRADATRLVQGYTQLKQSYPVNGLHTIENLATAAGLVVEDCVRREGRAASSAVTGPTVGSADYLFVTLRKPR